MKKMMEYDAKHWIQYLILALVISFAAVFCIPDIVKQGMGAEAENSVFSVVGLVAACVISFFVLLSICYDRCGTEKTTISFVDVFKIVLGTNIILILGMLIVSLLCGIMASLLYVLLQNIFAFDQIKGLIDFFTTVITILTLPLAVSVFWKEISSENGLKKALMDGLSIERKQYMKLMALLLILFGCGLLITTMFHFIQTNIFLEIIKMTLFAILGTIGMSFSKRILR